MAQKELHSPPLFLVHGGEPYLVQQSAESWIDAWRKKDPDLVVQVCRFPMDAGALQRALVERTLFGERICLVIHAAAGSTGAPAKGEAASWETLAAGVGVRDAGQPCVIAVNGTVKAGSPLLKAVSEARGSVQHIAPIKGRDVEQWCAKEASLRGLKLTSAMVHHIVLQCRGNVGLISQELEKCSAYAATRPITMDALGWLVVGSEEGSVWSIVECLASQHPARALEVYRKVAEDGRPPQFLIAALGTALHDLLLVGAAVQASSGRRSDVARLCSMPDWKVDKALMQLKHVSLTQLMKWISDLAALDVGIKRGVFDGDVGLEALITSMVAECHQPAFHT